MTEADLPALFRAADTASLRAQRRFLQLTRAQLAAFIVAAAAGVLSWKTGGTDIAAVVAAVAFLGAGVLQAELGRSKPERSWYDGRAVAESAKTSAWRYAVGGEPLPLSLGAAEADLHLVTTLRELPAGLAGLQLLADEGEGAQITAWMRSVRDSPLDARKQVYESERIGQQQGWYARKAKLNGRAAERWGRVLLATEGLGAAAAVVRAAGVIHIDLASVAAAAGAGATAWLQARQHRNLATAYGLTSHELSSVRALIPHLADERAWAQFVGDAEEAISREHAMWKSSRSDRNHH